ncbi:Dam family site-specific DNA-(adenine-N6)-methyltransferase [Escherichia coli]|uniref:Dam family site-specific DNA-(adenine-N6)-methyltransferase n=3 Tax=Escherichia coli TaxID=562 RepID=UPI001257CBBC|nr:Dam family site-specific DNA-(adenine-N6)-methyltransferase [Escherichia coli]EFC2017397.1 Dam family site-specific DNA-(adenine-N6)-methyltransferase [Escherichia coli]EFN6133820.1 Dam family site-specific DNA-(adenine-N6)-methyltransferase [Escherichia coli]EFO4393482.1 Dam family site-specific DNA-(adenine-N6)-methyltransferase [Escherichia coli]EHB7993503.1 Dam family site-specific DNA-(adenine-N6)-methyltransferase [Escherichia coli]
MSTILKWAGNKTAIMSELKKYLPAGPRLVEPFAGSCAVMMATDYPSYLVADINPDLINLYKKIAADCEAFISRAKVLFEEANSELAYYNIRQEFNYSTEITDFMKAIYFLYLNRHGYRGLCRYNKSGYFNIPYGNYKNPYFPEKEIRAFAEKAQRATFICASFDETLAMLQVGDVVYCDPPYDGTFSGYLVGTDENVLVLNRTYANRSNAERAAKMQWERLQRGVASFSLQLAEGRADLYTEMPVKVSGFKQPIDDAEWTITTLTHTVSPDNGFTTSLELEVRIDDFEME